MMNLIKANNSSLVNFLTMLWSCSFSDKMVVMITTAAKAS